jgi:hypothetical protein
MKAPSTTVELESIDLASNMQQPDPIPDDLFTVMEQRLVEALTGADLLAGGQGSGCHGDNCGRPTSASHEGITKVIDEWIKKSGETPERINHGHCQQTALFVKNHIPEAKIVTYPGHTFIEYKGKYYDAERPEGVSNFRDLPRLKEDEFKHYNFDPQERSTPSVRDLEDAIDETGELQEFRKKADIKASDSTDDETKIRKYAEKVAGYAESGSTFDPDGNYLCGTCSLRIEDGSCRTVKPPISMTGGGCIQWIKGPQEYQEQLKDQFTQAQVLYSTSKEGFGCSRCVYSSKAEKPDSVGRPSWCDFWKMHIQPKACCDKQELPKEMQAGGPGSGCKGDNCGRPKSDGAEEPAEQSTLKVFLKEAYEKWGEKTMWGKMYKFGQPGNVKPFTDGEKKEIKALFPGIDKCRLGFCYMNAQQIALSGLIDSKVKYWEGLYTVHGVPIAHAWVTYNGKVLDPTVVDLSGKPNQRGPEGTKERGTSQGEYWGVQVPKKWIMEHQVRVGTYGPLSEDFEKYAPKIFKEKKDIKAGGPGSGCHGPNCGRPVASRFRSGSSVRQLASLLSDGRLHRMSEINQTPGYSSRLRVIAQEGKRSGDYRISRHGHFVRLVPLRPATESATVLEQLRRAGPPAPGSRAPSAQPEAVHPADRTPPEYDKILREKEREAHPSSPVSRETNESYLTRVAGNPDQNEPFRAPKGFLKKEDKPTPDQLEKAHVHIPEGKLAEFETKFNMSPIDYKEKLLEGLSPELAQAISVHISGGANNWTVQAIGGGFRQERTFDFYDHSVDHDRWQLSESMQGTGIGKTVFKNQMDLYDHLGINRINVHANMSVGGYAWARFGFVPTQNSWDNTKEYVARSRISEIKDAGLKARIKTVLGIQNPKGIWVLAAMTDKMGDSTVGKEMLKGTSWDGSINLKDEEQYNVVRSYVGRSHQLPAPSIHSGAMQPADAPFADFEKGTATETADWAAVAFAFENGWTLQDAAKYLVKSLRMRKEILDFASLGEKKEEIKASVLFRGVELVGFSTIEEERLRALLSRVPPQLLKWTKVMQRAPELGAKHGKYLKESLSALVNPHTFELRQRFGKGPGWMNHDELMIVHEIGHSVYSHLPVSVQKRWEKTAGWVKGEREGNEPKYVEKRPGWPELTSEWTHVKGKKFPRRYSEKNPDENFADCFAFYILGKPQQMEPEQRAFVKDVIAKLVTAYPKLVDRRSSEGWWCGFWL